MPKKRKKREDAAKELAKQFKGNVAVYIDAANLEKSVQALGLIPPRAWRGISWKASTKNWRVDYIKLRKFFSQNSKLKSISFYTARFGTPEHDKFLTFLKKNGYRLITKEVKTISDREATVERRCQYCGKTNRVSVKFDCKHCGKKNEIPIERKADFDVEISVDAVDWIDKYNTFVLFSGDSDFVYLTEYLKRFGKTVIVLSRGGHIANELRNSKFVDYYQDILKLHKVFLRKAS